MDYELLAELIDGIDEKLNNILYRNKLTSIVESDVIDALNIVSQIREYFELDDNNYAPETHYFLDNSGDDEDDFDR